jgi:hypothetical protein
MVPHNMSAKKITLEKEVLSVTKTEIIKSFWFSNPFCGIIMTFKFIKLSESTSKVGISTCQISF